jgi:nicotinamide riboside transporter PnuC
MFTPRILNIIAIAFFAVSLIFLSAVLIYISIVLVVASIIYWRIKASRNPGSGAGPERGSGRE